jgi:hypothetical protein
MAGDPVAPDTTLAIVAGASEFPNYQELAGGERFAAAARDFIGYLFATDGFGLDEKNLLNVFDSPDSSGKILNRIKQFLAERQQALADRGGGRDLLFYYVGHGGFTANKDYFLAIQETEKGSEWTTIRITDLANVIKNAPMLLRRYLILDCCFAASAYKEFQSPPLEAARIQVLDQMPTSGTTLLCSSSARTVSLAPEESTHTMFSGALLQVLREGVPQMKRPLSMAVVGDRVRERIKKLYPADAVRPEVLSPDQREDDLKDFPVFPNAALTRRNFDCTLTIQDSRRLLIQYVGENGKAEQLDGELGDDPFARLTIQRLNEWVNIGVRLEQDKIWKGKPCEPDDLKLIGINLYRILFGEPEIRECFTALYHRFERNYRAQRAQEGTSDLRMRLRLTFTRQADDVARLPWEFLFVPGDGPDATDGVFFAGEPTELILTRYVPLAPQIRFDDPKSEPLRIMVAVFTPSDERGIERPELEALVRRLKAIPPKVSVTLIQDASWQALRADLEQQKPHVLHFIGYGAFEEPVTLGQRVLKGGLALVGLQDDPRDRYYNATEDKPLLVLTGSNLLRLFDYEPKPRLVFLHGCGSSSANSADAFRSQEALKECARDLVFARIPAVVAVQFAISHKELGAFATQMYTALAKGSSLDEAVKAGRVALGKNFMPVWEHPRFGTPLVYLQNDDPLVLPVPVTEETDTAAEGAEAREPMPGTSSPVSSSTPRASVLEPASAAAPASSARPDAAPTSSFRQGP